MKPVETFSHQVVDEGRLKLALGRNVKQDRRQVDVVPSDRLLERASFRANRGWSRPTQSSRVRGHPTYGIEQLDSHHRCSRGRAEGPLAGNRAIQVG